MTKKKLYAYEKRISSSPTKYLGGSTLRVAKDVKFTFIVYLQRMKVPDLTVRYTHHMMIRYALAVNEERHFSGIAKSWFSGRKSKK